jgi:hypothetical protein
MPAGPQDDNPFHEPFLVCCRRQEPAIHDCLAKITGQKLPEGSRQQKLQYWLKWWEANAKDIVAK